MFLNFSRVGPSQAAVKTWLLVLSSMSCVHRLETAERMAAELEAESSRHFEAMVSQRLQLIVLAWE